MEPHKIHGHPKMEHKLSVPPDHAIVDRPQIARQAELERQNAALLAACIGAEDALENRMDNASDYEAMEAWDEQCRKALVALRSAIDLAEPPDVAAEKGGG